MPAMVTRSSSSGLGFGEGCAASPGPEVKTSESPVAGVVLPLSDSVRRGIESAELVRYQVLN